MIGNINGSGMVVSHSFTGKDSDRDGKVSFEEFMKPVEGTGCVPADEATAPTLRDIFRAYDVNHDGFVSTMELRGTRSVRRSQTG